MLCSDRNLSTCCPVPLFRSATLAIDDLNGVTIDSVVDIISANKKGPLPTSLLLTKAKAILMRMKDPLEGDSWGLLLRGQAEESHHLRISTHDGVPSEDGFFDQVTEILRPLLFLWLLPNH